MLVRCLRVPAYPLPFEEDGYGRACMQVFPPAIAGKNDNLALRKKIGYWDAKRLPTNTASKCEYEHVVADQPVKGRIQQERHQFIDNGGCAMGKPFKGWWGWIGHRKGSLSHAESRIPLHCTI